MTDVLDRLRKALADRYAIEREIGSGGMATVYHAQDLKHERQVAVKVLRPELAAALGPERFLQEIKIAANLHHPHILPLYDSGRATVPPLRDTERGTGGEDFLYYVMPFVEGESLRDRIEREKQLPIDDALQIAREVADALSYAHAHGVIHRDIKPENILLESGHAVVADFGIARAVDAAGGERLTETGMAIGTPAYMSPEQAGGEKDLDGRSDLYSLGCVLHEMLAGQPPFTGPTIESLVHQHLSVPPPSVTTIRPSVPGWIAAALERSLAKTPADRFNPVAQFGEAISPRASVTGDGRPPTAAAGRRRWLAPGALATIAVLAIVAVALYGTGLLSSGGREEIPRLVVLPFENLGAAEDQYFADGMTEAITARISNMAGLQVISRTSAVLYKNTGKTSAQIGDELRVGYILEGTVQRERPGDPTSRVRITPQLIDVSDDAHLWARQFDENMTEVFRVQSDIAEQVASALEVTVLGVEREAMSVKPTASQEAYDAYLRGMAHYRHFTLQSQDSAMAYLELAVELDSGFALAHASLARVYEEQAAMFDGSEVWLRRALAASEKALSLDSGLAEAYLARGDILWSALFEFDYERSVRDVERALALNPNLSDAYDDLASIYGHVGMLDRASSAARTQQALDPLSVIPPFRQGLNLLWTEDYEGALSVFEPSPTWAAPYAVEALIGLGRMDEALAMTHAVHEDEPGMTNPLMISLRAIVHAADGDRGAAEEAMESALAGRASYAHAHHIEYNVGAAYALLGMREEAVDWFRQAASNGFPCLPAFERDAFVGDLLSDPSYRDLLDWIRAEGERLREVL